jgi:hypothetical protein
MYIGIAGLWISAWGSQKWLNTGQCKKVQDSAGECRTLQDSALHHRKGQCMAGQDSSDQGQCKTVRTVQDSAAGQCETVQGSAGQCRIVQDRDSAKQFEQCRTVQGG